MEHRLQKVEEADMTILVSIQELHVVNCFQIDVLVRKVELSTVE